MDRNEESIFAEALEKHSDEERLKFLDAACAGDPELRSNVDSLLDGYAAGEFLESPAGGPVATVDMPRVEVTEKPGDTIGPYKLREQIGEGGFGIVYLAEQTDPVKRRVALKIIKPGMDTREVVSRFQAERQALALMDHPNIAKVLDAGTTEPPLAVLEEAATAESPLSPGGRGVGGEGGGRPYFVMELVKGISITDYCDQCHLATRDRLKLFLQVCQAIQHAHQKGVIHRDVKPSNVLIAMQDGKPVPKVIDFGVANAINQRLTEHTLLTRFAQVVGTPLYMSPEQAEMSPLDVDTRSDIYSLGVLLYELLTGTTPFERERLKDATFDEMRRIIREEEPLRPSARISTLGADVTTIAEKRRTEPRKLQQVVSGDLDWIVMKALEKDRTRRYETASSLAEDVGRYLNDEPVQACPPSVGYRFRKFARRNKLALTSSAGVAVALIVLAIGAAAAAVRFQDLADEKAQLASDLATALDDVQHNLDLANNEQQRAEGNLDLAIDALDAVYLDAIGTEKLLDNPISRPDPGDPGFFPSARPPLTDLEQELLRRGLNFYDQFARQNASAPRAAIQTAQAYYRVGLLQAALGDNGSAVEAYRAAVERFSKLVQSDPSVQNFTGLADASDGLARVVDQWEEARRATESAIEACSQAIDRNPEDPWLYKRRAACYNRISEFDASLSDAENAVRLAGDNVNILLFAASMHQESLAKRDPDRISELLSNALAVDPDHFGAHLELANQERIRGNLRESLQHFDRALELDPDHAHGLYGRSIARALAGDADGAGTDVDRADALAAGDPAVAYARARAHQEAGNYDEAVQAFSVAEAHSPTNRLIYSHRGRLHRAHARYALAIDDFTTAIAISPQSWTNYKGRAAARFFLSQFDDALADLHRARELNPRDLSTLVWIHPKDVAQCPDEEFKRDILELAAQAIDADGSDRARAHIYHGALLIALGRGEEAAADAAAAVQQDPDNPVLYRHLATAYAHINRWPDATRALNRAHELSAADWRLEYELALCSLGTGDLVNYQEACRRMIESAVSSHDAQQLQFTAWTCSLAVDAVDDYEPALNFATQATESDPDDVQLQNTLGAVLYRAGRHTRALEELTALTDRLEQPDRRARSSPAYTWYFLAMTHQALGNADDAGEWLARANEWTEQVLTDEDNPPPWNRKLTLELLRDEANSLIDTDGPDGAGQQAAEPEIPPVPPSAQRARGDSQ